MRARYTREQLLDDLMIWCPDLKPHNDLCLRIVTRWLEVLS